ncbi:hypothetical protein PACTADRAFT_39672 [Pachysolen tannophilus NRRL Y-2460]|uniref:Ubiquinone biosynthesis O-methyltransferase, mitochondrial n=1 Tax=Pachysolen tannophilus NRRL Y-2460 TaxID=669874 RepID=A0A1E4TZ78_PACTA|nr:hypothetical protein PACTADRAFT_39672 [Pachysolen tannophilus NRRL Y-2460]
MTSLCCRENDKLTSICSEEKDHFNQLASSWWNINGSQRILHKMNLLRMDFIQDTISSNLKLNEGVESVEEEVYIPPYDLSLLPNEVSGAIKLEQILKKRQLYNKLSLRALDVGCGGGILSESLARLPIIKAVTGIDLSNEVLEVAKIHSKLDPLIVDKIDYKLMAIEDLPLTEKYEIITIFEMLEHVTYPAAVLKNVLEHVEIGGWVFLSTINRDFISWFTTIFMGEHILKIVPVGTHTLEKYINQKEIVSWFNENADNFEIKDSKGCIYLPFQGWSFTNCPDLGNYFMAIQRVK